MLRLKILLLRSIVVVLALGLLASAFPQPPAEPPADRTAELQRLIDAGDPIPPGNYRFSGQLVLRWRSLVGAGPQRTILLYTGAPRSDGCIKIAAGSWGYELRGFDLTNEGEKKGVGIGAGISDNQGQLGNQSGGADWNRVWVHGFETGVKLGDADGRAVSEMTFTNVQVKKCKTAITATAYNTLNLIFVCPSFETCDSGLVCEQAGSVHILGGAASAVKGTVFTFQPGGAYSVRGFRAETSGRLADVGGPAATTSCVIESCQTSGMVRTDGVDVAFKGGAALTVRDSILEGKVAYAGVSETKAPVGYGSFVAENVRTRAPVLLEGTRSRLRIDVRNSALLDQGGQVVKRVEVKQAVLTGPVQ
jgi:hypothetical protein